MQSINAHLISLLVVQPHLTLGLSSHARYYVRQSRLQKGFCRNRQRRKVVPVHVPNQYGDRLPVRLSINQRVPPRSRNTWQARVWRLLVQQKWRRPLYKRQSILPVNLGLRQVHQFECIPRLQHSMRLRCPHKPARVCLTNRND